MIRLALDTDDLAALGQAAVPFLLTYSDIVPDLPALQARYPHSDVLLIDRGLGDPGTRATLADVETGALTPADMPRWLDERHGVPFLTAYSNRNTLPAVLQAIGARPCWHWVATLDGTVHVDGWVPMQGPALVQILGAGQLGIHADLSLVLADGWHPARPPLPAGVPADLAALHEGAGQVSLAATRLIAALG